MSMAERPSIGSKFNVQRSSDETPDRAAGLAGLLPARRTAATSTAPAAPQSPVEPVSSDPDPEIPSTALEASPEAVGDAIAPVAPLAPVVTAAAAPASGGGGVAVVGVYLPPATHARVKEAARAEDTTYSDLLVEAFNRVSDESLLAAFRQSPATTTGPGMPTRTTQKRGKAGLQMNLRLSAEQRTWLDAKVRAVAAPSRSALVAEAFRIYLSNNWNEAAVRR
jgi:hypothetical protein